MVGEGDNFTKIDSVFGMVLYVDHSNFDHAKVLILMDFLFSINCKMVMKIENNCHKIYVSEYGTQMVLMD